MVYKYIKDKRSDKNKLMAGLYTSTGHTYAMSTYMSPTAYEPSKTFGMMMSSKTKSEWRAFNLNYDELHRRLTTVKKEFGMRKAISSRSLTGETRTFAEILDEEVEKIVLFYLRMQGELAKKLWAMREVQLSSISGAMTMEFIDCMFKRYRDLGQDVLALLDYLDINVLALRKILRRHDKQFDLRMTYIYFDSRLSSTDGNANSQLVQLYHQEGLRAIIGTIRRGFEDLHDAKLALLEAEIAYPSIDYRSSPTACGNAPGGEDSEGLSVIDDMEACYQAPSTSAPLSHQSLSPKKLVPRMPLSSRIAGNGAAPGSLNRDKLGNKSTSVIDALLGHGTSLGKNRQQRGLYLNNGTSKSWANLFHLGGNSGNRSDSRPRGSRLTRSISDLEPILKKISDLSNRVLQNQKRTITESLATYSAMALEMRVRDMARDNDDGSDDEYERVAVGAMKDRETSTSGLFISLFATFLYQANQYVVGPTSGSYANALGESPSMSGLIIGLSPFAAIIGAIVFSYWTNYSFKRPLVTSLALLSVGNLLYGLALQFDSVAMVFVGRMLTGLGAPRGIARRYIADHVSLKDRTTASGHFVTAGALGLALGPLISSLVVHSNYSFTYTLYGFTIVRYEMVTAPGFIMCGLFVVGLLMVLLLFEEPHSESDKHGNHKYSPLSLSKAVRAGGISGSSSGMLSNLSVNSSRSSSYGSIPMQQKVVHVETGDCMMAASPPALQSPLVIELRPLASSGGETSDETINRNNSFVKSRSASSIGSNNSEREASSVDSVNSNHSRRLFVSSKSNSNVSNMSSLSSPRGLSNTESFLSIASMAQETTQYCWDNVSIEVAVILLIYFVNKVGQETVVSSIPTLSQDFIGWSSEQCGYFMAMMGVLVLPAQILVSMFTKNAEDRVVMLGLAYTSCFFVFLTFKTSLFKYGVFQYTIGSVLLFSSLNAVEGIIMSLLSKLVSPELAKGTFNSGLLATEAGNIGRVVGDILITLCASSQASSAYLVNRLFVPVLVGLLFSIAMANYFWNKLEV